MKIVAALVVVGTLTAEIEAQTFSLGSRFTSPASSTTSYSSFGTTGTRYTPSTSTSSFSSLGSRYTPSTTTTSLGSRYTPSTSASALASRYTTTSGTSSLSSLLSSLSSTTSGTSSLSSLLSSGGRTTSYTPSSTTTSYTPSSTSSYTPSSTTSYTPSSYSSFSPQTYTDPRTRTYPEVKSYLKKKDLFDQNKLRSWNFQIDPQDFARMQADPAAEQWYPCTVTVDYREATEQTFQGAGCRYKGSVGSLRMCLDPVSGREDGSCRKISLKVDANKFNTESQKIGGLKKLNFHGMAVDHSLLAERTVYNMYDVADIPSPRAVNAGVSINGRYDGVYGFVEAPDDELTTRLFKKDWNKGKGALYKEAWIENRGIQYFRDKRESDKDEDQFMMEVVRAVMNTPDSQAAATMEKYFDTQSIVDVTAINTLVGATDDWRIRHNFFWYVREDENGKKLVMLPWDYDRINDERADSRGPAPGRAWHAIMQPSEPKCRKRESTAEEKVRAEGHPFNQRAFWLEVNKELPPNVDIPVQCDKITRLMSLALKDRVDRRVLELADVVSSYDNVDRNLDAWYQQLLPAVRADRSGDPPNAWTFQSEVNTMKNWFKQRKQKAVREASGYGGFSSGSNYGSFGSTLGSSFGGLTLGSQGASLGGLSFSSLFQG